MTLRNSLFALVCIVFAGSAPGATIYVTTETPGIGTGACSLQEAIYSSVLHDTLDRVDGIAIDATDQDHFIATQCVLGTGDDTIVLPTDGMLTMKGSLLELTGHDWQMTKTASAIGISRKNLWNDCAAWGLRFRRAPFAKRRRSRRPRSHCFDRNAVQPPRE